MSEDKDLVLLATLELYDRQLILDALTKHRREFLGRLRDGDKDRSIEDAILDAKVLVDKLERCTQLMEVLK